MYYFLIVAFWRQVFSWAISMLLFPKTTFASDLFHVLYPFIFDLYRVCYKFSRLNEGLSS